MSTHCSYAELLCEVGTHHPRVIVLDAGLATSMQTHLFAQRFPTRYLNLGIAEQNAVGVAAGLARRGFVPILHSFSNFLARRAHDQIALSVAWAKSNVKLVGGSCGLFDGRNGPSHFGSDDVAVMSAMPGMAVMEPADLRQLGACVHWSLRRDGPTYLRLRRHGAAENLLPAADSAVGTMIVKTNPDAVCTLVIGGSMLDEGLLAVKILTDRDVAVDVFHVSVIQPLDSTPIINSVRRTGRLVTIENHSPVGGFGDAVARSLDSLPVRHVRLALPEIALPAAEPAWLLQFCRLDAASLADQILTLTREPADV